LNYAIKTLLKDTSWLIVDGDLGLLFSERYLSTGGLGGYFVIKFMVPSNPE